MREQCVQPYVNDLIQEARLLQVRTLSRSIDHWLVNQLIDTYLFSAFSLSQQRQRWFSPSPFFADFFLLDSAIGASGPCCGIEWVFRPLLAFGWGVWRLRTAFGLAKPLKDQIETVSRTCSVGFGIVGQVCWFWDIKHNWLWVLHCSANWGEVEWHHSFTNTYMCVTT